MNKDKELIEIGKVKGKSWTFINEINFFQDWPYANLVDGLKERFNKCFTVLSSSEVEDDEEWELGLDPSLNTAIVFQLSVFEIKRHI